MRNFDENYLQALARREAQVENDLISSFTRQIKAALRSRLRSSEAVEDACQETLLRVFSYFRNGRTLRSPESLPAFIHAICTRVAMEANRAESRSGVRFDELPDVIDLRPDPESKTIAQQRRQTVWILLAELSDKDRHLLRSVCLDEEDREVVCRRFRVSRDHLRLLLYRARLRFKDLLQHAEAPAHSPMKPMVAGSPDTLHFLADGSRRGADRPCSRTLSHGRTLAR